MSMPPRGHHMTTVGVALVLLLLSEKPVTVVAKECGVALVSPHPMAHHEYPAPTGTGKVHLFLGQADGVVYALTCLVDPSVNATTAEELLQANQNGMTGHDPANLISQLAVTLHGKPGRELRTRAGVGQTRARTFVLLDRVVTVSITGGESRVLSPEAHAFLGSLRSTRERLR